MGGTDGRCHQRLVHHLLAAPGMGATAVLVHHAGQQFLIQAAPVHTDAHRLVPAHGGFDHLAELLVLLVALAHVARVDAVFGQSLRAIGKFCQKTVAVIVKIPDQRHIDAHAVELLAHIRHGLRGLGRVDGNAHQFGAGLRQFLDLDGRTNGVHRIGIGHRLHTHRRIAADGHHALAMAHNGLQRGMAGRSSNRYGIGSQQHEEYSVYLSSKRATPIEATLAMSKGWPRSVSCTFSARPMVTRTG